MFVNLPAIITVTWNCLAVKAAKEWNGNYSSEWFPFVFLYPLKCTSFQILLTNDENTGINPHYIYNNAGIS